MLGRKQRGSCFEAGIIKEQERSPVRINEQMGRGREEILMLGGRGNEEPRASKYCSSAQRCWCTVDHHLGLHSLTLSSVQGIFQT